MRALKHCLCGVACLLTLPFVLGATAVTTLSVSTEQGKVSIPIAISLSYAIAGVEFAFEISDGLEFERFEKSEAVSPSFNTPVITRGGGKFGLVSITQIIGVYQLAAFWTLVNLFSITQEKKPRLCG